MEKGFTVIEMLFVFVIMGLLVAGSLLITKGVMIPSCR